MLKLKKIREHINLRENAATSCLACALAVLHFFERAELSTASFDIRTSKRGSSSVSLTP